MSCIMERINQGKFVLIAEIGVNYYDIAKKEGISNMEAAKLMVREAKKAPKLKYTNHGCNCDRLFSKEFRK